MAQVALRYCRLVHVRGDSMPVRISRCLRTSDKSSDPTALGRPISRRISQAPAQRGAKEKKRQRPED